MRPVILLAASLLVLAGCGGKKVQAVQPQLEATKGPLDFGAVPVLNAKPLTFDVQNLGRAPLTIKSLALAAGSSPAFSLEGTLPDQVGAGEKKSVVVVFKPTAEQAESGTLHLETDDPSQPALDVALKGLGSTKAAIAVEATGHPGQQSLDFGRVGEGKIVFGSIDIKSQGTADLIIDGLSLDGDPDIRFQSSSRTPVTVPAGSTLTLQLAFAPPEGATSPASAALHIHCTDPDHQDVAVPLTGTVNRAPVAKIADVGPLAPGQTVQLDGSSSNDPDGDDPLAFTDAAGGAGWSVVSAPVNSTAVVAPGNAAQPQVTLDLPGTYVVQLVVTDATGLQTLHPAQLTLVAKPAVALQVELVWDNPDTDMDLHFLPHGAQLDGPLDCWANNKEPDLGVIGDPSDDPVLSRDALDHFGPEEMVYVSPVNGSYDVDVNFYSAHGSATPATTATIRVWVYGQVVAEYSRQLANAGQTWSAVTLDWPSGAVTKVDTVQ